MALETSIRRVRLWRLLVACGVLAVTLLISFPSVWHLETPGSHCAVCHAGSLPFLATPVTAIVDARAFVEERIEVCQSLGQSLLVLPNEPSRAPPA